MEKKSNKYNGKFKKGFLINSLNFKEDEANYIMKVQKSFPEIMDKDVDEKGFVVDGEKLCKELGVKGNFNDWLLANRSKVQGKLIKYRCVENTDFICISRNLETQTKAGKKGITIKNKITLTLDCAKKIAMRQNNEAGDMICDYFILMEKAIRSRIDWFKIRHPEIEGYKRMSGMVLKNYKIKNNGNKPKNRFIYSNEADMLNLVLFGKKSKEMKEILDINYNDSLRDNLATKMNSIIFEAQMVNITNLLDVSKSLQDRKECLQTFIDNFYKNDIEEFKKVFELM